MDRTPAPLHPSRPPANAESPGGAWLSRTFASIGNFNNDDDLIITPGSLGDVDGRQDRLANNSAARSTAAPSATRVQPHVPSRQTDFVCWFE